MIFKAVQNDLEDLVKRFELCEHFRNFSFIVKMFCCLQQKVEGSHFTQVFCGMTPFGSDALFRAQLIDLSR